MLVRQYAFIITTLILMSSPTHAQVSFNAGGVNGGAILLGDSTEL